MAIKKSDLYSELWNSCSELRGGMDASQYKDYILVLLFVKYVTDKSKSSNSLLEVPKGASFEDMLALRGSKEIGNGINTIIGKLIEENELKGSITLPDFTDEDKLGIGKEKVDKLTKLLNIFKELDFSNNHADGDDILGDAYEYLMRHFATESGKSKGQFYTPAEVSRIMAKVLGVSKTEKSSKTVYDPTCGSGSLLLKVAEEAENKITIYGQENDLATSGLAVMNMFLHGNETAEIKQGNTLANPKFVKGQNLNTFDYVVANPPFSHKGWTNGFNYKDDPYKRFEGYQTPPEKNGDYAFFLHCIKSLKSTGKGAIVLPHGVLFRGNTEGEIRKELVKRGYIKGIIGLPANLFYGTSIPAAIIVFDKENAEARKNIMFIDASKDFTKDGNKNRLRDRDLHKIVDVFNNEIEIPKYSKIITIEEIEKNEYNLNIPRYINTQVEEDIQSIEAHLFGGIPKEDIDALEIYWNQFPTLKNELFRKYSRENFYELNIDKNNIKEIILNNEEIKNYSKNFNKEIKDWNLQTEKLFRNFKKDDKPKKLILKISESVLETFSKDILIDKYNMYQYIMNYWNDILKDDLYMIAEEDWKAELKNIEKKDKKGQIKIIGRDCDLIPKSIIEDVFFSESKNSFMELEERKENVEFRLNELKEENSSEESVIGDLTDILNSKINIQKRVIEIKDEIAKSEIFTEEQKEIAKKIKKDFLKVTWNTGITDEDEIFKQLDIFHEYLQLLEEKANIEKEEKRIEKKLENEILAKYLNLTEEDIKDITINKKWLKEIRKNFNQELDTIIRNLADRITELAERYEETLFEINSNIQSLEEQVSEHLKGMGYKW